MSLDTVTQVLELKLGGVWTNIAAWIDKNSGIAWQRGTKEDRQPYVGTLAFSLRNTDEVWTPANASSVYFNMLRKGTEVRLSYVRSAVTYWKFTGFVDTIKPTNPHTGPARLRVAITCKSAEAAYLRFPDYSAPATTSGRVGALISAVASAIGLTAVVDAGPTGQLQVPFYYPRANAIADLQGLSFSDPPALLYFDGQGRLQWRQGTNMIGGQSPLSAGNYSGGLAWGVAIAPEGDVVPDYRNDSQYAVATVSAVKITPATVEGRLWSHPLNKTNGAAEPIEGHALRLMRGKFDKIPISLYQGVQTGGFLFVDSGDGLRASVDVGTDPVMVRTSSASPTPSTFAVGMYLRIENEVFVVDSVSTPTGQYLQNLTCTRAQLGTVKAYHAATTPPIPIFVRPPQVTHPNIGQLTTLTLNSSSQSFNVDITGAPFQAAGATLPSSFLQTNDVIKIDSEEMRLLLNPTATAVEGRYSVQVSRAFSGNAVSHPPGSYVGKRTVGYPPIASGGTGGGGFVESADNASGLPATNPDVVGLPAFGTGQSIKYSGRDFVMALYNNSASRRWIALAEIWGFYLAPTEVAQQYTARLAIPYIPGQETGPGVNMPYGTVNFETVKGLAVCNLFAYRMPSPWLDLTFTANDSTKASTLSADVGDLVKYVGTTTGGERIDDWFRIAAIAGGLSATEQTIQRFTLRPAHQFRDPSRAWFTEFGLQDGAAANSLGDFEVKPATAGGWAGDTDWRNIQQTAADAVTAPNGAYGSNAAPAQALENIGTSDQEISAGVDFGVTAHNTYPVTTGGIGVVFRSNSSGTNKWAAYFNRSQSLIYLWNSTDAVVASVAWTATATPEIAVRAMDQRIRVYVDANPEPVIDVANKTRFQTNTYAGPYLNRTIVTAGTTWPRLRWWAGMGL